MKALARKLVSDVALPAAAKVLGSFSALSATRSALPYLGPDGYKSVKLNMTEAQAVATGLLTGRRVADGCVTYRFVAGEGTGCESGDVVIGRDGRIQSISATARALTREGAWNNMPLSDVKAIYPRLAQDERQHHLFRTPVPGSEHASYTFAVNDDSVATRVSLHRNDAPGFVAVR
ncbi:hypothetical protein N8J89_09755 [Crossiella sp. CA-258035]|uniref:hypothetical protein n=1 Tax=Crossiella sp. CA-258035 TaxID=2981138 RepID=UPI0024BC0DE8|nr:hypothetical protein [Crossiella sp. CA-258035]WHT21318.1 hypothetical protein N8J89_09755 [Crossiella sp. CA-258035]